MRNTLHIAILLLISICSKAQWPKQVELTQQMHLHTQAHPASVLFVHFDKNIYTNNETVWFTGYVMKAEQEELERHNIMSVALVRDADSIVIKQEKFLLTGGLAFGCMLLPDSMLTGPYHFIATTNLVRNGIPDLQFMQPVIIKTNIDPPFMAGINLLKAGEPNLVRINVTDKDDHPLKLPVFIDYRYGKLKQRAKANAAGQLELQIPEQDGIKDPNLYAKVRSGNDSTFINLTLPVTKQRATVNFYPEGGYLIEGLPGRIAWEVKDQQGAMVAVNAALMLNDDVLDTVATNSSGIASSMITPFPGRQYKLKLLHDGFEDSIYLLPEPLKQGVSLFVQEAAVQDTLQVRILTTQLQKVGVRIHDFRSTYFYDEIDLNSQNKTIKIPIHPLPRGLKTLTLSDSLGRPLSERIFFAKYDTAKRIDVTVDKPVYNRREKVTMRVKLTGMDTLGIVSAACVQDNRINARFNTDIESYYYLKNELEALPLAAGGRGIADKQYVENVMLVKGWRKYSWLDIVGTTPRDTVRVYDTMDVRVRVTRFGKPVKKPMQIGLMRGMRFGVENTNEEGIATIGDSNLIAEAGQKVHVVVLDKRQENCNIETDDSYKWATDQYARNLPPDEVIIPSSVRNNRELALKSNEKVRQLKEVVIRAKNDDNLYFTGNECGDYVCQFNILNCQNHRMTPGNRAPVPGKTYMDGFTRQQITYVACKDQDRDKFIVSVPAIYTKKEFYVDTYAEPLEPAYVSTLYWNHAIMLDGEKEGKIEFYTGDIQGVFRIVVQGVTSNDVGVTECTFEVKGTTP